MKYKEKRYVVCIAAVTIVLAIVFYINQHTEQEITDGVVDRPDYTQESQQLKINVYVDGSSLPVQTSIELEPRQYSAAQIEELFAQLLDQIFVQMCAENESLNDVSHNLNLMTQIERFPVEIEWYSSNYSLVGYDGTVFNEGWEGERSENIELTAHLTYMEYQSDYAIGVTIVAPERTELEQENGKIVDAMKEAEQSDPQSETIQLPDSVNGQSISYTYWEEKTSPLTILILGILAIAALLVAKKQELQKQKKMRTMELKRGYSEMVSKLTLLVGAGMTVRRAWEKIVNDSQNQKRVSLVYEEMAETHRQMKLGVPESVAYERFGRRCNTKEYLKLSTLLEQNIRRGTTDLIILLEQETVYAFEERKNLVKKQGEEAGTKLLLPMIMMLAIVMIIIMVPAIMSFQI